MRFGRFWDITLPAMKGISFVAILLAWIGSFMNFAIVQVMTAGGPANSSEVFATLIYKNAFLYADTNYAATLGILLLILPDGAWWALRARRRCARTACLRPEFSMGDPGDEQHPPNPADRGRPRASGCARIGRKVALAVLLPDPDALSDVLDHHLVAEDESGNALRPGHLRPGSLVARRLPRDVRAAQFRPVHRQRDVRRPGDHGLGHHGCGLVRLWVRPLRLPVQAGDHGLCPHRPVVSAHPAGHSLLPDGQPLRHQGHLSRADPGLQHLHPAALPVDHEGVLRADSRASWTRPRWSTAPRPTGRSGTSSCRWPAQPSARRRSSASSPPGTSTSSPWC